MTASDILVYGYGNPGRQDDGIGPALAEMIENSGLQGVVCDSNYQLNIEDAYNVSKSSAVVFLDASSDGNEPFSFQRIDPSAEIRFTTHAMSPQSVLALADELYRFHAPAYLMAIRGYSWDFGEPMTREAETNMNGAFQFLQEVLKTEELRNGTLTIDHNSVLMPIKED